MLRGTYFAIHTYTHAGDILTASILERYFPPRGAVDISLFVHKSFAVTLSTSSNLDCGVGAGCVRPTCPYVQSQHTAQSVMAVRGGGEKRKSRKVRKGEQQAANRHSHGKREAASENTTSQSKQHVFHILRTCEGGQFFFFASSSESMFSLATLAVGEKNKIKTPNGDKTCGGELRPQPGRVALKIPRQME